MEYPLPKPDPTMEEVTPASFIRDNIFEPHPELER